MSKGVAVETPPGCICEWDFDGARHCPLHMYLGQLRKDLAKQFTYLGSGCSRTAFASKNGKFVYKVPHSWHGIVHNKFEARAYAKRHEAKVVASDSKGVFKLGPRLARCKLAPSGILVMELLSNGRRYFYDATEGVSRDEMWELSLLDSAQGGFNREGQFQLYDYSFYVSVDDEHLTVY